MVTLLPNLMPWLRAITDLIKYSKLSTDLSKFLNVFKNCFNTCQSRGSSVRTQSIGSFLREYRGKVLKFYSIFGLKSRFKFESISKLKTRYILNKKNQSVQHVVKIHLIHLYYFFKYTIT